MRAARGLIVTLLVLAVLAVIADSAARALVERQVAGGIQRSQRLADSPGVSIGGSPFLLEAARGRYDEMSVQLGAVSASGGVRLTSVDARLTGVTAPVSSLRSSTSSNPLPGVRADAVSARALVSYPALTAAFAARLPKEVSGLTLTAAPSGDVQVALSYSIFGASIPVKTPVRLTVSRNRLVVSAPAATLAGVPAAFRDQVAALMSFSTPLPALPYGLAVSGVDVQPDGIVFAASGHDVKLGSAAGSG